MDSQFGYSWVFKEYPQKSQIWKSETNPNLRTWLGIPSLGFVSLYQIWDFCGYSLNTLKYPKLGFRYFFLCKLTSLPVRGFIAQLVQHHTGIAEVTGSNPIEALILFSRLVLSNCLNWKIYCDDHSSL